MAGGRIKGITIEIGGDKSAIRRQTRKYDWYGTITTTNGKVYHFTTSDSRM